MHFNAACCYYCLRELFFLAVRHSFHASYRREFSKIKTALLENSTAHKVRQVDKPHTLIHENEARKMKLHLSQDHIAPNITLKMAHTKVHFRSMILSSAA